MSASLANSSLTPQGGIASADYQLDATFEVSPGRVGTYALEGIGRLGGGVRTAAQAADSRTLSRFDLTLGRVGGPVLETRDFDFDGFDGSPGEGALQFDLASAGALAAGVYRLRVRLRAEATAVFAAPDDGTGNPGRALTDSHLTLFRFRVDSVPEPASALALLAPAFLLRRGPRGAAGRSA